MSLSKSSLKISIPRPHSRDSRYQQINQRGLISSEPGYSGNAKTVYDFHDKWEELKEKLTKQMELTVPLIHQRKGVLET